MCLLQFTYQYSSMDHQEQSPLPPHVLIFPFPAQGHVNSMLKLAELLSLAAVHVTFLLSDFAHRRLLRHTDIHSRFSRHPGFRFETISDGLPDDHPRAGGRFSDLIPSVMNVMGPLFREMMVATGCLRSEDRWPVTCVIADGLLGFAGDFALEKGIQLVYFRTVSACSFWASFCIPEIIEAREFPLKGNGMDLPVKSVPGMEGLLRRRDLPAYFRIDEVSDPVFQAIKDVTRQTPRAQAVILNTFENLEGPVLSHIRTRMPDLFTVGPLHAHLKSRASEENTTALPPPSTVSGSFWEEDRSCIEWLDSKPPKSVIYVSFGSIAVLSRDQFMEFWHGLVNSGQYFLWVIRPDSIAGKDGEENIKKDPKLWNRWSNIERGYTVGWAPQEEVLNHRAIGGFLTHSGWNSTLESIVAGVPMICWPYFADQMINSRFVSEMWKIGLDMKDTCDRVVIEKMVRDLMVVRKNEFIQSADRMAKIARETISVGGSSYCNLDRLIEYIKSMIV